MNNLSPIQLMDIAHEEYFRITLSRMFYPDSVIINPEDFDMMSKVNGSLNIDIDKDKETLNGCRVFKSLDINHGEFMYFKYSKDE